MPSSEATHSSRTRSGAGRRRACPQDPARGVDVAGIATQRNHAAALAELVLACERWMIWFPFGDGTFSIVSALMAARSGQG